MPYLLCRELANRLKLAFASPMRAATLAALHASGPACAQTRLGTFAPDPSTLGGVCQSSV